LYVIASVAAMAPFAVSAQMVITRIMYDPPGADTGHEWVELLNTGTSSVHLTGLRLRVGNANHKIIPLSGDGTLGTGAHAAIAQDSALFSQDNAGFAGPVFRASFSLTNTNGTVEIVDKSGAVIASKSYQAPEPTPVAPKPVHAKAAKKSKGRAFAEKPDFPTVADSNADIDPVATLPNTAMVPVNSNASFWWMGAIALAGVAGVATFASRHVAKCEWDIVEETSEDV